MIGRRVEVAALHAAGHEVPIEMVVQRRGRGDQPVFMAFMRNLTERRRAEAEIARQREELHQSEKFTAMGSPLAGVAHELNNPRSVVVRHAAMLREPAPDPATLRRAGGSGAVVSDPRMPGLGGLSLRRAKSAKWPALARRTLSVTGDALSPEVGRLVAEARQPLLEKRLDPQAVRAAVAGVLPTGRP